MRMLTIAPMQYTVLLGLIVFFSSLAPAQPRVRANRTSGALVLRENWRLQSSAKIKESGALISSSPVKTIDWYTTKVPSTVLAALVDNKVYHDPYFGMNLRSIPGTTYPIGAKFSNLPMPEDSPFRNSWWFRNQFLLPMKFSRQNIWLHFNGINFRANIWLNGRKVADAKDVVGTFRLFEFDVTDIAKPGALNILAVEVLPPQPDDLALGWVDWNPTPPDKNMGLWHDVYVTASGPVTLRYPQVITELDLPSLETAHLTVSAELRNISNRILKGTLRGRIEGIEFSQTVSMAPNELRTVSFTSEQFKELNISQPHLWWPTELGPQNLYKLELDCEVGGQISDRQTTHFGIREITSVLDKDNHRIFNVNGRNLLIRGGGWAPDMLLRYRPERLEQEFRYVRDMHLNTIRTEGKLESDYFYDLADRYGILIMAGWCCCDQWEHWESRKDSMRGPTWDEEDYVVARHSQEDQIRRLRNHPSLLAWLNSSDNPPPPDVEKMYVDILAKYRWPTPYLSSASGIISEVSGISGVKMEGPYEWVPPAYWLLDKDSGGAFGFATEISPGPAVPPVESLRQMLPKDHLWPIDEYWSYHCGGAIYSTLSVFTDALNARYGTARGLEDYAAKSQLMTYEAQRAMFEAYARNKYRSSGVIQWMLNNAWPSMIWHLYDYYLRPGGGYFGTKKACEPIHIQYSYDDRSIVVVNGTYERLDGIKAAAKVFDLSMLEKYSNELVVSVSSDDTTRAFTLPKLAGLTTTYFLKLMLHDKDGKLLSSNFYWLSTKDEILDWSKAKNSYTPTSSYADFTALERLRPIRLTCAGSVERRGDEEEAHVTVKNKSSGLALAIRLQIARGRGADEILPVLWEDNYFTLMPGEKRELLARYGSKNGGRDKPILVVDGWNVRRSAESLVHTVKR